MLQIRYEQSNYIDLTFRLDDGKGDYNRSYDKGYDDFDYADYSTDKKDNNFRTSEKKKKDKKPNLDELLKKWD